MADELESQGKERLAEQRRGAGLSVSNNIAEGSAGSEKEFKRYLSIARSSVYELADMSIVFEMQSLITENKRQELLKETGSSFSAIK